MEYCPTEKMWCDIPDKPKQGAPYRLERNHLMNVSVDYDNQVELKDTHPMLLDIKQDKEIEFPPCNRDITKAGPSPVGMSVLGNCLRQVRWYLARVPRQNGFWVSSWNIMKGNIQARGRAFKSRAIGRARVGPNELEGVRVFPQQFKYIYIYICRN